MRAPVPHPHDLAACLVRPAPAALVPRLRGPHVLTVWRFFTTGWGRGARANSPANHVTVRTSRAAGGPAMKPSQAGEAASPEACRHRPGPQPMRPPARCRVPKRGRSRPGATSTSPSFRAGAATWRRSVSPANPGRARYLSQRLDKDQHRVVIGPDSEHLFQGDETTCLIEAAGPLVLLVGVARSQRLDLEVTHAVGP